MTCVTIYNFINIYIIILVFSLLSYLCIIVFKFTSIALYITWMYIECHKRSKLWVPCKLMNSLLIHEFKQSI